MSVERIEPAEGAGLALSARCARKVIDNARHPHRWNRYAYVGGNPLGAVDPLGLGECVMAGGAISTSVSQETCTGGGNTWIKSNVTVEVTPDSGGGLSGNELDAWELENQTYNFWVEQSVASQPGSSNSGSSGGAPSQNSAPAKTAPSFTQCVAHGSDELNPANLIGLGNSQFAKGALGGPFSLAVSAYAGEASAGSVGGFGSATGLDAGSKLAAGISGDPAIVIYPHFTTLTENPLITNWSIPVREAAEGVASLFEKIDPLAYALDLTTTAFVAVGCAGFGQ